MADQNKYYDVNEHKSYSTLPPGKVTVGKQPDGTYIIKQGNEYIRVSANDPRVTGRPKMASETLKEKAPSLHTGIDKYQGANESEAVDNKLNEMGNFWWTHPQQYIRPSYWDSNIHQAVHDGNNIAALTISTPFLVYGGVQAFPYIKTGLEIAGQALTPSTWLEGLAGAAGYTVPEWMSLGTDLAASSYLAYQAGKDLDEKGLTWDTGLNALLSLAPFTRDKRAVDAVANTFSFGRYKPNGLITSSPRVKLVPRAEVDNTTAIDNTYTLSNTDDITYSISNQPSSTQTSASPTTGPDWYAKPVKRADGNYELVDGTVIPEEKVQSPILERYLGTPVSKDNYSTTFSQNGTYTIAPIPGGGVAAHAPWDPGFTFFPSEKDGVNYLLNHRKQFIDDIQIPGMADYIKNRRQVHPIGNGEDLWDNPDRLSPTYSDFLKETLKKIAYDFYLSPQYIDRFTKVFGGDKVGTGKGIAHDLDAMLADTNIIEYSMPHVNHGISQLDNGQPGNPDVGYIGLNTNSYYLDNKDYWTSALFHELGHNIRKNNTSLSSSILRYSDDILRDNPIEYSVDLSKLSKNNLNYMYYISRPEEFRQRVIEGVRYMWKNNLTPEQVVSNPTNTGFDDLKEYIKKDYLIKMLGMMLATSPLIMKNNDNET